MSLTIPKSDFVSEDTEKLLGEKKILLLDTAFPNVHSQLSLGVGSGTCSSNRLPVHCDTQQGLLLSSLRSWLSLKV